VTCSSPEYIWWISVRILENSLKSLRKAISGELADQNLSRVTLADIFYDYEVIAIKDLCRGYCLSREVWSRGGVVERG
jgi:hypothetical protein